MPLNASLSYYCPIRLILAIDYVVDGCIEIGLLIVLAQLNFLLSHLRNSLSLRPS